MTDFKKTEESIVEPHKRPPLNLYDVRHGESEGNVDRNLYKTKADHALRLTPKGVEQAKRAGGFLAEKLWKEYQQDPENFGQIRIWHSSYYRARETAEHATRAIFMKFSAELGEEEAKKIVTYREEPFLIEQKAGLFDGMDEEEYLKHHPLEKADYDKQTKYNGRAYASSPLGDSRLGVLLRVKPFFGTIMRDYQNYNIRHVIAITHGVTVRAMVMGLMRYPIEWLDAKSNPKNCWVRHMHGNRKVGYKDEGYIYGEDLGEDKRNNPMATQNQLPNAGDIFMLKPQRPNSIVPLGVKTHDPFAPEVA